MRGAGWLRENRGLTRAALSVVIGVGCGGSDGSGGAPVADSAVEAPGDVAVDSFGVDATHDAIDSNPGDVAAEATGDATVTTTPIVYVATGDGKISTFDMDPSTGKLTPKSSFDAGDYPSFVAVDRARLRLYAVLEPSDLLCVFSSVKSTC